MTNKREFLEKCHKLSHHGWFKNFQPGSVIARGFADIGFEQFYILHDYKIVSLLTGKISDFEEESRKHFFLVPTTAEIIKECELKKIKIVSLKLTDENEWLLVLQGQSPKTSHGPTSEVVLIEALLEEFSQSLGKGRALTATQV